ncbi:glucose-6-phosphate isomerase [Candidatus Pelagibacter sp.]|jgi:glucose-6-phosphate isomerase|nr:glucose-6-phosphate isomerase [Candidatus Pelagibacter sp.]
MLGKNIEYKKFKLKKNSTNHSNKVLKIFKNLINEDSQILSSMGKDYKDSYGKKLILKLKKIDHITLIGMGGSILGAKSIYKFLKPKLKKFTFIDNFSNILQKKNDKKNITLIISKSGNTLETISNSNIMVDKKKINIFITENKNNYLRRLANKLKAEVVNHNNFIGGRYSVLSEVGMLPAQLMGFKPEKFRRLNQMVKNKNFTNSLIQNVSNILTLTKKNKTNSIILNYDDRSTDLFNWYQQLLAESLGKKSKGILPVVSSMPRDNHSLMQYYLDGVKNHFFTFFFVKEKNSKKIKNNEIYDSHFYLQNKNLNDIAFAQFAATERVFNKKNIPYRSFIIHERSEETIGELFTFFILETILLAKAMKINPYDQPAVELIKDETSKILKNS